MGAPQICRFVGERRNNEAPQVAKRLPFAEFLPTTGAPKSSKRGFGESGGPRRPSIKQSGIDHCDRGAERDVSLCDPIAERDMTFEMFLIKYCDFSLQNLCVPGM